MKHHDMNVRLAFREEGEFWVAYLAEQGTMKDALALASIRMGAVQKVPARRAEFMALVQELFADACEATIGQRPTFPHGEQPAPEHERAKE